MLKDKIAIVTGSTSGIGAGIARALAAKGCRVVLNGRRGSAAVEALQAEITRDTGAEILFCAADMSKAEEIDRLIERSVETFGGVDILVNNAGVQHVAPLAEFPVESWDLVLATNLTAAFLTTRAVLPMMRVKRWGRIVNIASAHGLVASRFKSAYVAAKHGLLGLTKVTALETAEEGITCNALCPGYVWTPMIAGQIDDQAKVHGIAREQVIKDVILAPQPTKEFISVEEVAEVTAFLVSDFARSITGAAIPIEGGWTAR
jgi:3-hydroxybutyrate dehydrogenase